MKKLLLITIAVLTILFTQAQCQAYFSYIQNGSTTVFTDLSTMQSTNYSATWDWDLGDGNYSTQQSPTHTYANNGIYWACLIVTYYDSTTMNWCTSSYCDSIFVGNSIPPSWDCNPTTGCYDPGTGLGQYSSFASCDTICGAPTPSWDCPINMPGGCYDPGTGLGQYTSLAACQLACAITPSWDCNPTTGCYDPGTGLGQYTSLAACQSNCSSAASNLCDSMIVNGSQNQPVFEVVGINIVIDYWVTTSNDGTLFQEDSMSTYHTVFNYPPGGIGQSHDTLTTCITYADATGYSTCCVTWIWDVNLGVWAKMGSVTFIGEIASFDKALIKVVDMLGRETKEMKYRHLFYIYNDGTVEKRMIIE